MTLFHSTKFQTERIFWRRELSADAARRVQRDVRKPPAGRKLGRLRQKRRWKMHFR